MTEQIEKCHAVRQKFRSHSKIGIVKGIDLISETASQKKGTIGAVQRQLETSQRWVKQKQKAHP
jgi:hypothetical protein